MENKYYIAVVTFDNGVKKATEVMPRQLLKEWLERFVKDETKYEVFECTADGEHLSKVDVQKFASGGGIEIKEGVGGFYLFPEKPDKKTKGVQLKTGGGVDASAQNVKTKPVHISEIRVGDTIEHNGEIKTVSGSNIKKDSFMGRTLFGDSYRLGNKYVNKVVSIDGVALKFSNGGGVGEKVYIEFLNKKKGFKQDKKYFKSYEEAVKWARKNFERFDADMIKYEFKGGGEVMIGKRVVKMGTGGTADSAEDLNAPVLGGTMGSSMKTGGGVDGKKKYIAPSGMCFVKLGSHRASDKVRRTGVKFITLYNLYWSRSAGMDMAMMREKDYEKIKHIKSVGNPLKKLPVLEGEWHTRGGDEALRSAYDKAYSMYMKTGGNTKKAFVQKKIGKVMHEFKKRKLKTPQGKVVTNPKQAIAIGFSEASAGWKHKRKK